MNKQQIYWLSAVVVSAIVILTLQFGDLNILGYEELTSFVKGFFVGLFIPLVIRFVMECRKKRS